MTLKRTNSINRPDCMVQLGLLPPYSLEDVKKAYQAKARAAHPDAGGSEREFMELSEAYRQAEEYVRFAGDRRHWIGELTERYIRQMECFDALAKQGAVVELEQEDWRSEAMDDFAQLTQVLIGIRWGSATVDPYLIEILKTYPDCFSSLRLLDLAGSHLSDDSCSEIARIKSLIRLDLRRTDLSVRAFEQICKLPRVEEIHVKGCRVGWFKLLRLKLRYRNVSFHSKDSLTLDASPRRQFGDVLQWSLNRG